MANGTAGISLGRAWRSDFRGHSWVGDILHPKGSKIALAKGVDWGWTKKPAEAIELSPYWQARFKADMRRCGYHVANSPAPQDEDNATAQSS